MNPRGIYGRSRSVVSEMLKQGEITVSVIGQGKLGLPLALVIADHGARVIGVDKNPHLVEGLNQGRNPLPFEPGVGELLKRNVREGRYRATTQTRKAAEESDFIIITVPVTADQAGIKLEALDTAMKDIAKGLSPGAVIITETTLPPGTTESYVPLLEEESGLKAGRDFGLGHAPERTMSGRMLRDITESYPKVIGALDDKSLEALAGLYTTINKRGVIAVRDIRTAEAVKVFEGVYRDVNIALANELALISHELGIDILEAISVANTQPYSHIHRPGAGVGGHCIPVYPWFLVHLAPQRARLIRLAREVNLEMPRELALLTIRALNTAGRVAKRSRIILHGLAYRNGVKEHLNTPTFTLARELESWGARVEVEDPLYEPWEIHELGLTPYNGDPTGADALVFVTDHSVYRERSLEETARAMRTKVLVDGRYLFTGREDVKRLFYYAAPGLGVAPPHKSL